MSEVLALVPPAVGRGSERYLIEQWVPLLEAQGVRVRFRTEDDWMEMLSAHSARVQAPRVAEVRREAAG